MNCIDTKIAVLGNISGIPIPLEGVPEELAGVKDSIGPLEGTTGEGGDVEEALKEPLKGIPSELSDYADGFQGDKVMELPLHCSYDLEIVLQVA